MRERHLLDINSLEIGMILGENFYNKNGVLLIKEGSTLTETLIKLMKKNIWSKDIKFYIDLNISRKKNEAKKNLYKNLPSSVYRDRENIRDNFRKITTYVKDTFEELKVNQNSVDFLKKIRNAVIDIKENLKVNVEVLNELISSNAFDDYLYRHSVNVAVLSHIIGQWLNLDEVELDKIIMAGLLHDIGKCNISPKILNKPGKLTLEEFEEVKKHSMYSYEILKNIGYDESQVLKAVSLHHEKIDGSGYPFGLKGEDIPLYARILTVSDIFDAMTSNRVYKKKELPFKVMEMFQREAFGKLDPKIVMVFVNKFSEYYLGTQVMLNNGKIGKIIKLNNYDITRPLISVDNTTYIDTSRERNVGIIAFVENESFN